jgi:hypothetical protein
MGIVNKEIKDNYEFYQELLSQKKHLKQRVLLLEVKKNNINWMKSDCNVYHTTIEEDIFLMVESSKRVLTHYGFKLQCKSLCEEPFFRFDSDGPSHRNKKGGLNEQKISTPHFNSYDEKGYPVAYKTEVLKNNKNAESIVGDINFGLSHFCQESNLSLEDDNFPEIKEHELTLFNEAKEYDPLKGVDFI